MKLIIVTVCVILFDFLTGFLKAIKNKKINSTKLREGLYNKISEILAIVFAYIAEKSAVFSELNIYIPLVNAIAIYITLTETISILENLGELNHRLKKLFLPYLKKLKEIDSDDKLG